MLIQACPTGPAGGADSLHPAVRAWTVLPDVASVNWHEDGADWKASPQRDRLLAAVGEAPPVLLHGEGTSCWPALRWALRRGLDTRIGLEDVLHLPDGSPAPDNAALVRAAVLAAVRAADGAGG